MNTLLSALLGLSLAGPARASTTATEPTMEELLNAADDIDRGDKSHVTIEMQVKTERYERTMKVESWAEGKDKTLIRILEPAKDAGVATLKVDDNIWNYLPKVDRTMKVPAGMMGGSWMGSHFTNDDLVKESRMADDYSGQITEKPAANGTGQWTIELTPKPDAPVVWGKVVVKISPDKIPTEITYFDEKGALVRTMSFSDITTVDGRAMPRVMTLVPADKPDEFTKIIYDQIDFNADIPDGTFTQQALKR